MLPLHAFQAFGLQLEQIAFKSNVRESVPASRQRHGAGNHYGAPCSSGSQRAVDAFALREECRT